MCKKPAGALAGGAVQKKPAGEALKRPAGVQGGTPPSKKPAATSGGGVRKRPSGDYIWHMLVIWVSCCCVTCLSYASRCSQCHMIGGGRTAGNTQQDEGIEEGDTDDEEKEEEEEDKEKKEDKEDNAEASEKRCKFKAQKFYEALRTGQLPAQVQELYKQVHVAKT